MVLYSGRERRLRVEGTVSEVLSKVVQNQLERFIRLKLHDEVYRELPSKKREERYRNDFTFKNAEIFPGLNGNEIVYPRRPLIVEPRISVARLDAILNITE